MRIYDGRVYFCIEKYPFYSRGVSEREKSHGYKQDVCLRYWHLPFGLYLSKRQKVKAVSNELHQAIYRAARRYWKTDNVKVHHNSLSAYEIHNLDTCEKMVFYEETYKLFKLGEITFTDNRQVLFCEDNQKYYGYSHRGVQGFGIGDMLFVEDAQEIDDKTLLNYYRNKKYRRDYLKCLKRHHRENDGFDFKHAVEAGILYVVPFKERGLKRIKNLTEAFEAARNIANYLS